MRVQAWDVRPLLFASSHAVADTRLSEYVCGAARIVSQFAQELLHDCAHPPGIAGSPPAPDPLQQSVVGQHSTGVGRKLGEQPKLHCGQPDRTPGQRHAAFEVTDVQVSQLVVLSRFRGGPPAQRRLDSRCQLRRRKGLPAVAQLVDCGCCELSIVTPGRLPQAAGRRRLSTEHAC